LNVERRIPRSPATFEPKRSIVSSVFTFSSNFLDLLSRKTLRNVDGPEVGASVDCSSRLGCVLGPLDGEHEDEVGPKVVDKMLGDEDSDMDGDEDSDMDGDEDGDIEEVC
jgi:hypothetical protein